MAVLGGAETTALYNIAMDWNEFPRTGGDMLSFNQKRETLEWIPGNLTSQSVSVPQVHFFSLKVTPLVSRSEENFQAKWKALDYNSLSPETHRFYDRHHLNLQAFVKREYKEAVLRENLCDHDKKRRKVSCVPRKFVRLRMNAPDLVLALDGEYHQLHSWTSLLVLKYLCNIMKFWHEGIGTSESVSSSVLSSSSTRLQGTTVTFSVPSFILEAMSSFFKAVELNSGAVQTAKQFEASDSRLWMIF